MMTLGDGLTVFTDEELSKIPNGTILENTSGVIFVKQDRYNNEDVFIYSIKNFNGIHLPCGVRDIWNHELKNLFLQFKLTE